MQLDEIRGGSHGSAPNFSNNSDHIVDMCYKQVTQLE
jgi:hypothetical protein